MLAARKDTNGRLRIVQNLSRSVYSGICGSGADSERSTAALEDTQLCLVTDPFFYNGHMFPRQNDGTLRRASPG